MDGYKVAFIIPTKDRYPDLEFLCKSMLEQSRIPDQVIIIDSSSDFRNGFAEQFRGLNLIHRRASLAGTVRQKNEGKKYLSPDIKLVGYLDDDIVLDKNAVEIMVGFFAVAKENIGGASFNIVNYNKGRVNFFTWLFCINRKSQGKILASGYNETFYPVLKDMEVEWLSAGATVWARKVVDEFSFDEYFTGYGLYEEVDYCCRVGREYKLFVLKDAKVIHNIKPVRMEGNVNLSIMDVKNRYYIVKKYPERFLKICFYWATLGDIFGYFFLGLIKRDKKMLFRSLGYIKGLRNLLKNIMLMDDCIR